MNIKGDNLIDNKGINIDFNKEIKYDEILYDNYIDFFSSKDKTIKDNDKSIVTLPNFPILIGNRIRPYYYTDIYKYLYFYKYNINNLSRYPDYIIKIKDKILKDKKKKIFRNHAKKYELNNNNKFCKKIKKKKKVNYDIKILIKTENNIDYLL